MREAVGICVVVGPGLIDMSVAGDVSTKSAEISACVYQEHSCGVGVWMRLRVVIYGKR